MREFCTHHIVSYIYVLVKSIKISLLVLLEFGARQVREENYTFTMDPLEATIISNSYDYTVSSTNPCSYVSAVSPGNTGCLLRVYVVRNLFIGVVLEKLIHRILTVHWIHPISIRSFN